LISFCTIQSLKVLTSLRDHYRNLTGIRMHKRRRIHCRLTQMFHSMFLQTKIVTLSMIEVFLGSRLYLSSQNFALVCNLVGI
jgi:hypothetical protein